MMEYLHRTFGKLENNLNFNYHSRCEKLSIMHICFVDDLLVFTRGDSLSMELAMKTFKEFSDATGLAENPQKGKVFFGNVDVDTKVEILSITGFSEGKLPFSLFGNSSNE